MLNFFFLEYVGRVEGYFQYIYKKLSLEFIKRVQNIIEKLEYNFFKRTLTKGGPWVGKAGNCPAPYTLKTYQYIYLA